MFYRRRLQKGSDDIDDQGRTGQEAYQEHYAWCVATLEKNPTDDDKEVRCYVLRNSPTWIARLDHWVDIFNGDFVFNAFLEANSAINDGNWDEFITVRQKEDLKKIVDEYNNEYARQEKEKEF